MKITMGLEKLKAKIEEYTHIHTTRGYVISNYKHIMPVFIIWSPRRGSIAEHSLVIYRRISIIRNGSIRKLVPTIECWKDLHNRKNSSKWSTKQNYLYSMKD